VYVFDLKGQTPLHMACGQATNVEVVRALIAAGANVTEADANGWTALHCTQLFFMVPLSLLAGRLDADETTHHATDACMENAHKDLIWLLRTHRQLRGARPTVLFPRLTRHCCVCACD
jgi:hypothetical protein